jgi:hypothetical protein
MRERYYLYIYGVISKLGIGYPETEPGGAPAGHGERSPGNGLGAKDRGTGPTQAIRAARDSRNPELPEPAEPESNSLVYRKAGYLLNRGASVSCEGHFCKR